MSIQLNTLIIATISLIVAIFIPLFYIIFNWRNIFKELITIEQTVRNKMLLEYHNNKKQLEAKDPQIINGYIPKQSLDIQPYFPPNKKINDKIIFKSKPSTSVTNRHT